MNTMSDEEWSYELSERIIERALVKSDRLLSVLIQIFKKLPEKDTDILLYDRDVQFVCPQAHGAVPIKVLATNADEKDEKAGKLSLQH